MSTEKFVKSYILFTEKEKSRKELNIIEIQERTGWSNSTIKTYISKKWDSLLFKKKDKYFVSGILDYTQDQYVRMMSQKNANSQDPYKPHLQENIEGLVIKARESAILALDIYNRPLASFKSEGFIVMMIIAWTSLLHAIFEKEGINYYYKNKDGENKLIDDDLKCWELSKCISEFYKGENNPVRLNISFMIGLRNKIEHRFVPKIDNHIGGECQALLLNFDDLLTEQFSNYYSLKELLVFPLQTSNLRHDSTIDAVKKFQGKHYHSIKEYIDVYRNNVNIDIYNDPKYSFRVFLMPKTGNHKNTSDMSMEFIPYDVNKKEDMDLLQRHITIIKEKNIQVANQGKFKPTAVVIAVKDKIKRSFSIHNHTMAYKYYKIRLQPNKCNVDYCQYDEPHKDYIYTQKWIDFLVEKLSMEEEYQKIIRFKG
jgi:hypothetical protein